MQASESQVYLSFYSERSQGSSPRSGVKVESCSCNFDNTAPVGAPLVGAQNKITPQTKGRHKTCPYSTKPRCCHFEQSEKSNNTAHWELLPCFRGAPRSGEGYKKLALRAPYKYRNSRGIPCGCPKQTPRKQRAGTRPAPTAHKHRKAVILSEAKNLN